MKNSKETGPTVASKAGKQLEAKKTPPVQKSVDASALAQAPYKAFYKGLNAHKEKGR